MVIVCDPPANFTLLIKKCIRWPCGLQLVASSPGDQKPPEETANADRKKNQAQTRFEIPKQECVSHSESKPNLNFIATIKSLSC